MGFLWNWNFVFGTSKLFWFIPYDKGNAGPVGEGTFFIDKKR